MVEVTNSRPDTTMPEFKNLDLRYFFSTGRGVLGYSVTYTMYGQPYSRRSFLLSRGYIPISSFSIDSVISGVKKRLSYLREVTNAHMLSNDSVSAVETHLLALNTIAPKFTGISVTGETIDPTSVKGRAILLDFSCPNCGPCHLYLPLLGELYNAYSKKGLVIFGVDPVDADNTALKKFQATEKLPFNYLLTSKGTAASYGISGYPALYLIDSEGHIVFSGVGFSKLNTIRLKAAFRLLLQKRN
jgi:thiol-disulfide isomerase/thioredoxin